MKLGDYILAAPTDAIVEHWRERLRRWCIQRRDLAAYARKITTLPLHLQSALVVDEKHRPPSEEEINDMGRSLDGTRLLALLLIKANKPGFNGGDIVQLVTAENCRETYRAILNTRPRAVGADDAIAILRAARSQFQQEQAACPQSVQ